MVFSRQRRQENIVYLVLWLIMFLYPVMSHLYAIVSDTNSDLRFNIDLIIQSEINLLPFFVLFLIHNYIIAPLIDNKAKRWIYGICLVGLLMLFVGYKVIQDRVNYNRYVRPAIERMNEERERAMNWWNERMQDTTATFNLRWGFPNPDSLANAEFRPSWEEGFWRDSPDRFDRFDREGRPGRPGGPERGRGRAPWFNSWDFFTPILFQLLIAFMMLIANLGVRLFFSAQENEKKMLDLENENILQQLQYLRYQINPHFFMNTLNNIHALVDIDPDEAKACILELSKLMRYVLYEGGKPTIPLEKEVEFLNQYISLMKIRYTDTVKIEVDLPENTHGSEIPPLLFVSFVENAFKHGISYKFDSYIRVRMYIENDRLMFSCENSLHETNEDPHSGIGLENVKKRLGLLYGTDFSLDIENKEGSYKVLANVPLSSHLTERLYKTTIKS